MRKTLTTILLTTILLIAMGVGHTSQKSAQDMLNRDIQVIAQLYIQILLQDMAWIDTYGPRNSDEYLARLSQFKWKVEGEGDTVGKRMSEIVANGGDCDDFTLYAIALAMAWVPESIELGFVITFLDDPNCKIDCGHISPVMYSPLINKIIIIEYIRGVQGNRIGVFTFQEWREFTKNVTMGDQRGKRILYRFWYLLRKNSEQPPIRVLN